MINYKLLTPGPLTTTKTVKQAMLVDHCTWDEDYKKITREIREKLVKIAHCSSETYTCVLMQGSGTFGVEATLSSVVGNNDKLLIIANGTYGKRMAEIAKYQNIPFVMYESEDSQVPDPARVKDILDKDSAITHVSMVHSETTTGIINPVEEIVSVVKASGRQFILDAMSSFGGVDIEVEKLGIDYLVSSANKCIQGVPGFSFIICRRQALLESRGKARSLSLSLLDQYETMEIDGKWRFTSPTHVVLAFEQALKEFEAEGGVAGRNARYAKNNRELIAGMRNLGFKTYIDDNQGPIITTFLFPEGRAYDFQDFYQYIKDRGYAIYPGKVTAKNAFRIGNIGEIYSDDIEKILNIIESYLKEA